jgi:two-component system phosphate regulon sensor histidine kinase PhoR
MDSSYKKIRLIFLLIIALPTAIFTIYEIGSYKKNEEVINTIYDNQLDAILYSVNEYSNIVISGWRSKMDIICNSNSSEVKKKLNELINELPGVQTLFQFDMDIEPLATIEHDSSEMELQAEIARHLKDSAQIVKKLERYIEENYQKVEPFDLKNNDIQVLVFIIKTEEQTIVNALVLNSLEFIEDVLDPKIQQISQDKFYIGAFIDTSSNVIYNSDKKAEKVEFIHNKPFWFFSDYYLGIELKGQSISQVVKARSRQNIYIIAIIDLVLLFGAWLIYRNLKKQMELAQLKSDFISNVSHEIRTPLALISMYIETLDLNRVKTEEKKKEYYSIIYNETQRLSNLVNKILNFSQIENDKRKYVFAKTNLNNVVNEVVNTFKYHLEDKNFELQLELDNEIPQIMADSEALTDSLVNLVDNAIKYSGDQKFLGIKTGQQKDGVFIEIKDNGIGISESDQKKIFEKFYRVTEKNLAYKAKGSGLGLSIVKHVIDKHNGKINIKSKVGSGTSFRLIFPLEK